MIKTQIINGDNKPVAVILDYQEYLRLNQIEEDVIDYNSSLKIKGKNKDWIKHTDLKRELDL